MDTVYLFIDTNIALHYKRPNEIDWCSMVKSKSVLLVATPVLLKELDKFKYEGSKKIKKRAREYIRWLGTFIENPEHEIRPGVRWKFIVDKLDIDFDHENLGKSNNDDKLIAHVLQHTETFKGRIFVVTDDTSLKVKLKLRNIEKLGLPDNLRLPDEPDPLERENKRLKSQLRRVPILSVSFEDKSKHLVIPYSDISAEQVLANIDSLEEIKEKHPHMTSPHALRTLINTEKYNNELEEFYMEYEKYLKDLPFRHEVLNLFYKVEFTICNTGTSPATNIDLDLDFPNNVRPIDEDYFSKLKIPEPPNPPKTLLEKLSLNIHQDLNPVPFNRLHQNLSIPISTMANGESEINIIGNKVHIHCMNLKHGSECDSDAINFHFKTSKLVKSFNIESTLLANETPTPIKNTFHIEVKRS